MGRRESLRTGIPDSIPLPKFLTTEELDAIRGYKRDNPTASWEDAVDDVIRSSKATQDLD